MMKGEQGFTLIELLIVVAITGFIFSVLGAAIHHIVTIPEEGNDRVTALHELQNAAHWVNIDGQMAQSASGGNELVLTLPDSSSISYTLVGTDLLRTTSTSNRTLAENIASANFTVQGRIITVTLASAPDGRWVVSENETYQICMRPSEG